MNAIKIAAYIVAGIIIFFGILFIWGAFGAEGQPSWIFVGVITVAVGIGIILAVNRFAPANANTQNITLKVDLPANVNLDTLKCKSCGGSLTADHITMVAGAPVVSCPYCKTTYQLTEEPKW